MERLLKISGVFLFILLSISSLWANGNVYVGIYMNDISEFEIAQGRFHVDMNIWCKWYGTNSSPQLTFVNGAIESSEVLRVENDGDWHSVLSHVQGTFRGTFPLHRFPFDKQKLSVSISIPSEWGRIIPDLAGSGMSQNFSITGWKYRPYFQATTGTTRFYSDFGSIAREGEPFEANMAIFSVEIARPLMSYLLKFIFPLMIIIMISFSAFFTLNNIEANLSVGLTSLLTCVALHFSQGDSLPNVSYLIAADQFFIWGYLIILGNIVVTLYAFRTSGYDMERAKKIDGIAWKVLGGLFIAGYAMIAFLALHEPAYAAVSASVTSKNRSARDEELTLYVMNLRTLNSSDIIQGLLMRGLAYEVSGGNFAPHLAATIPSITNDSVYYLNNGRVIVQWRLKKGLRWSDGSRIDSGDIAFSLRIQSNRNVIAIRELDKYTIAVEYLRKNSDITKPFPVYPERYFEKIFECGGLDGIREWISTNGGVLDGPYVLESFVSGSYAHFVRNPYFAGGYPVIGSIWIRKLTNEMAIELSNGHSDIGMFLSTPTFTKATNLEGFSYRIDPSPNLYFLQPDLTVWPLSDPEFRRALILAIDRSRVSYELTGETNFVAGSYRPCRAEDFVSVLPSDLYSPSEARRIVARFAPMPVIPLYVSKYLVRSPEYAVILGIRADLEKAGIPVKIVETNVSGVVLFQNADHGGLVYINRSSFIDEQTIFWNPIVYPAEMTNLTTKLNATLYDERKLEISKRLQTLWAVQLPIIPLTFGVHRSVYRSDLSGWNPEAVPDNMWWNVEKWMIR